LTVRDARAEPAQARGTERFYVPALDGLRFCAFALVFLHHSPVFPGGSQTASVLKEFGWIGVDLFFVLSAYLLIALLQREHVATGSMDLGKFFARRILRIWPLFYVYVAACYGYSLATGSGSAEIDGRTIGHLFFLDNVFTALTGEYNPLNFTSHLWTIAFEEQFYLFIPLLFAAVVSLRRHGKLFALTMAAVILCQPLLRWGVTRFHDDERTFWVIPFLHADAILVGLLLGAGVGARLIVRVSGDLYAAAGAMVLGLLLFAPANAAVADLLPERQVYFFSVLALSFFLIVLGCLDQRSRIAWVLSRQPFVFLGRISYGLYVWHLVGHEFGPDLARRWLPAGTIPAGEIASWLSAVLPALLLTLVLAVTSYFALERPFLLIKQRFTVVPNRRN